MEAVTRRRFLGTIGAAGAVAAVSPHAFVKAAEPGFRGTLCFFSKHLPRLDGRGLGRALKPLGFAGVDLTVRPGGHIDPKRVAQDLPPYVADIRREGLSVPLITTELVSDADPAARPTLETAASLGIPFFKPGYYKYAFLDARKEVEEATRQLRSLAELSAHAGVHLGFHNHAGYIGGGIWDIAPAIDTLDPKWTGYYFDVRHAVVEGGDGGWRSAFNVVAPRLSMIALKDFFWERTATGWRQKNCPMGEGMVQWKAYFALLARAQFHGPISLHLEYDIPGATPEEREEKTLAAAARDLAFVKARIAEAYGASAALPAALPAAIMVPRATDIHIDEVHHAYEDYVYRAPYKFGGRVVDRVTLLNVRCRVTTGAGKTAWGFGSMTMGNMWAFPSKTMSYDTTLDAMKGLAARIEQITADCRETGHPIDLNHVLEPEYLKAARDVSASRKLDESIPKLCTLVVASAFDAAVHDAFGKVHGRNVYATYGADLLPRDLSAYLGKEFRGERLDAALLASAQPRIPLFHSVGGLDPLESKDVQKPVGDGLPETLPEWIAYNGLVRIKIKLSGEDLASDTNRILAIDRVTTGVQAERGVKDWSYCLDFNERCPNVDYVLECLRRVRAASPAGFDRILYVEQPTARDLRANRQNVMHDASKLRPVVIDESLTDLESLLLAREMGYTGVALKACKGQSQAMLMAAAAKKYRMFTCVQDLTCPGASLIHSVGISAHVPGVAGIEANARQYVPAANEPWASRFPGIFQVRDGYMRTGEINGPGLGIPDSVLRSA
ncbi:MAG TPA: TIM barrel protein [Vicinamibacterales bacterium]|nr:TIM barrel protein [Vicinamibacterales bacterium]